MNTDQLADTSRGGSAGIGRRLHGSDIAADKDRDVSGADVLLTDQLYVCGLHHCIRRLDRADESLGFDHSECF